MRVLVAFLLVFGSSAAADGCHDLWFTRNLVMDRAGDWVGFSHIPVGDWSYVTVHDPGWPLKSGGWVDAEMPEAICTEWAG